MWVRESYRVVGEYVLNQNDLLAACRGASFSHLTAYPQLFKQINIIGSPLYPEFIFRIRIEFRRKCICWFSGLKS